ncbi:MAG: hypothetical protein ACPGES_03515, partial [Coraliomargarita sp.]
MPFKRLSVCVCTLLCLVIGYGEEPPAYLLSAVALDRSVNELQYVSEEDVHTLSVYRKQRSKTFEYQGAQQL